MAPTSGRSSSETDASRAQIGVLGDGVRVYGGIRFYTSPTRSLDLLPFNLGTNIRNFLLNYLGTEDHPVPFGGRQDALARLEQWRVQSDKRFLLLATPAGRGKSALLARWAEQLSRPEVSERVAVVFVPISSRFNTNLPELVLACIAVQLALLLGEEVPSNYINMPPGFWQSLVGEYLRRPLPGGRQLLLIVDGLDEAAWDVDPALFPQDLPATTRVVVSARYLAGDLPGPGPWLGRLGWERFGLGEAMALDTLTHDGMRDVLANMGRPLDTLLDRDDIIDQLYSLTHGDPLLVELYVDWLYDQGESSVRLQPEELARIEPDYRGFFRYWWEAQERLWSKTGQADPLEKQAVRVLLSILATALGPLSIGDVKQLMPVELSPGKITIRQALRPLRRFVIGDGEEVGLSFAHPRLADYFCEEFLDDDERRAWQAAFVHWGLASAGREPKSDEAQPRISPYLLQYLSRHLALAREPVESFLCLLSFDWMTGWHRYAGTYVGFLRDVDVVLERLVDADRRSIAQGLSAPYIGQEIRCVLCHASVVALYNEISPELLVALRRYGGWTDEQVLTYAQQKSSPHARAEALVELAPYLSLAKQLATYQKALQMVLSLPDERWQARVLSALAPHLPEAVYEVSRGLSSERARVLVALVPHLPQAQQAEALWQALQTVWLLPDEWGQAEVLSALAPHLPKAVYQAAQSLSYEGARAHVGNALLLHLPEAKRTEALQQALQSTLSLSLWWGWEWGKLLGALAPHLPEGVYQATLMLSDELARAEVLSTLAPHLPEEVFRATLVLSDECHQARVLSALAPHLPEAAYQAAQSLSDEYWRAEVLCALVPHLPKAERAEALQQAWQFAQTLPDEWERLGMLSALAPRLPDAIFQATLSLSDEEQQAKLLIALAPHLPRAVYQAALSLSHEPARARVMSALASYLPEAIYQATPSLLDEWARIEVLSALAPHLPGAVYQAVWSLSDEWARANVLSALTPYLPEVEWTAALQETLQTALSWPDEQDRARGFEVLAPLLPKAVYEAAQSLSDELWRAGVLISLTPRLPEAVYEAARSLSTEKWQAFVLSALAPHLPEVISQAVQSLSEELWRAVVLLALAPHLPEVERAEAIHQVLQFTQTLSDEQQRVEWLSDLAPHQPEAVYQAALSLSNDARAEVLSALAPYMTTLSRDTLYIRWATELPVFKQWPRSSALDTLAKFVPVIESLGGATALSQTLQAVEDVYRWWP